MQIPPDVSCLPHIGAAGCLLGLTPPAGLLARFPGRRPGSGSANTTKVTAIVSLGLSILSVSLSHMRWERDAAEPRRDVQVLPSGFSRSEGSLSLVKRSGETTSSAFSKPPLPHLSLHPQCRGGAALCLVLACQVVFCDLVLSFCFGTPACPLRCCKGNRGHWINGSATRA